MPTGKLPSRQYALQIRCTGPPDGPQQPQQAPYYNKPIQRKHRPLTPGERFLRKWQDWWGPAPRVRMRTKLDDRQREQVAELAVLNERLAGNPSYAARRRIEWLKVRRKHWKHIYEYVTKQDAAITLSMIEEASQQVAAALSEDVRDRIGIVALRRHLQSLQTELGTAHERLHVTQQRVQANRQRIQQIESEIQGLEGSIATDTLDPAAAPEAANTSASAPAGTAASQWVPVMFSSHLKPADKATVLAFGQPWVVFWGADRQLACLRDTCAHRACPLSLGKVENGQISCPYHGWRYNSSGACTEMPSTRFAPGLGVQALSCMQSSGLVWITSAPAAQPAQLPPELEQNSRPRKRQVTVEVQVEADVDSSMLLDWLLNMPMPRQAPRGLQGVAALQRRIALSMWHSLLGSTTLSLSPASLSSCSGEGPKGGWQWHACLPTGKDQSRWLIRVGAGLDPSAPLSAHLLRWLVKQVAQTQLELLKAWQQQGQGLGAAGV